MKQEINRYEILEKVTPVIENTAMRYGRWFLRIFLYSRERDVTLDDCENVTRSLGDFMDELIPVKYHLEVSSPGLERKFKSEKEFIIFKGRRIKKSLSSSKAEE